jgi:DNA-binding transcriptional MerR regulator/methylmalonyl-CoA mutase cobalamin-binding subunit
MYNIQLASSISGINVHNLRAWERRYNAVSPERDSVGRRLYSKEHVEKLYILNQLVKEGTAIRHIAGNSSDELLSLAKEKGLDIELDFDPKPDDENELELSFNAIKLALNFKKFDIINHEISKVLESYDLRKVVFKLLIPTLFLVRDKLNSNEISRDEKQTIVTLIKYFLRKKVFQNNVDLTKASYLVASPLGDKFELQSLIASLLLSAHGKQVIYLGPNVSSSTIAETAQATGAENVVIWGSCNWDQSKGSELAKIFQDISEKLSQDLNLEVACNGAAPYEFFITDSRIKSIKNFEDFDSGLSKNS